MVVWRLKKQPNLSNTNLLVLVIQTRRLDYVPLLLAGLAVAQFALDVGEESIIVDHVEDFLGSGCVAKRVLVVDENRFEMSFYQRHSSPEWQRPNY